jgi:hypothetical protein
MRDNDSSSGFNSMWMSFASYVMENNLNWQDEIIKYNGEHRFDYIMFETAEDALAFKLKFG